jgi:AraC-like DNA-binding protein
MMLAQDFLRSSDRPIGSWLEEVGYASESAFSQAFKRQVGVSPTHYRLRMCKARKR